MSVTVSKHVEFDAAHRVLSHDGKCRHLHGHRYRVTLTVEARTLPDSGMVRDFSELGAVLRNRIHDALDHSTILESGDPLSNALARVDPTGPVVLLAGPPTAENIGVWCIEQLARDSRINIATIRSLEVRETPTSAAIVWMDQ